MTPEERFERIESNLERLGGRIEQQQLEIDKNAAAIRDLIVVSRTLLTATSELRETQKRTDERLNVLIETVDRFVRSWKKTNGNQ